MNTSAPNEIYSSRELHTSATQAYEAFANPEQLQKWWGPEGFSNIIHEFDLQVGGKWLLTMHGPDNAKYQNASIFTKVEPNVLVAWTRTTQPLFDMEVAFEEINPNQTKISFSMIFKTVQECEHLKNYILPKNEENFDRLERELLHLYENKENTTE